MGRSDPTSRDRLHSFAHSPRLWSPSGGESVQVKWAATSVNLTLMLESALLLLLTMHSWPRPRLTAAHIVSAQCQPHRPSSCPPQSPAGFIVSSNCSTRWYVSFCASGLPSLPSASFPHVVSCSREPDRFPALLAPPPSTSPPLSATHRPPQLVHQVSKAPASLCKQRHDPAACRPASSPVPTAIAIALLGPCLSLLLER